jgi:digeranylgeranylglycerophospholipid reductase
MHDVVIIGGGPAGLCAAARLATAGFHTALLEEHGSVGEPVHCTGVLAAAAFDEFTLPRRSLLNQLTTARFRSPAGHEVTYSGERVEAVVIDRRVFDQDLLERATAAGVDIERGARVRSVQIHSDGVIVSSPTTKHRARACILACGANYSLHRQVGLGMPRLLLHTAQLELPARRLGDVELHFGAEIAPKGFGWVVPVARARDRDPNPGTASGAPALCARIGVMCDTDAPRYFQRLAERIAPQWGVEGDLGRPRQKILPLAPISRTYADRLLAIGDAAGLVKPTTGGGIYYSLVWGAPAAATHPEALWPHQHWATPLARY